MNYLFLEKEAVPGKICWTVGTVRPDEKIDFVQANHVILEVPSTTKEWCPGAYAIAFEGELVFEPGGVIRVRGKG